MSTKRGIIESLRNKLRERNADSDFSNQFLYTVCLEHAKWLIKREISAGRIYSNTSFFQTLGCQEVIETSTVEECCPVKVKCKIYRTKNKLPDTWIDNKGPVVQRVTSVDSSTDFTIIDSATWPNKSVDPYSRKLDTKYAFFGDGYLWFPEHNPHRINIVGFYTDDISQLSGCIDKKPCQRYLDTQFMIPGWLEAEMFSKALEQLAGVTERLQPDNQPDKNITRKN
jgi:hypothetical protein